MSPLRFALAASLMREVLGEIEAATDAQTYDERQKLTTEEVGVPDDHEFTVKISERLFRQIGKALSAADAAKREAA